MVPNSPTMYASSLFAVHTERSSTGAGLCSRIHEVPLWRRIVPVSPTAYTWPGPVPCSPNSACDGGSASCAQPFAPRRKSRPPAPAAHTGPPAGPQTVTSAGDVVSVVQEFAAPRITVPSQPAVTTRPALSPHIARRFWPDPTFCTSVHVLPVSRRINPVFPTAYASPAPRPQTPNRFRVVGDWAKLQRAPS